MGISGIFKQIGPGTRISLAKLSAEHFVAHGRPLRIAIDISIWLFQIQAGKGGSNPALRTFYYRLLRLLTLNIHPLFVFDGPNKPLFKRNKKVGGPGVRVASVPEFLAKQLLKQFGFPWHVAPGEAEAECALIQMEGIVDAVLSEDVDTLMFGSTVTYRNWTPEDKGKTPTHVNLYKAADTKTDSGLDREGMILVALMSGGDYLPDGIPGCGPKVACDAARAGFGSSLCSLNRTNRAAIQAWKTKLEHEIKTNESKYFSQKKPSFNMPQDFPNLEVLGYYTHPCVSSEDKLSRLRSSLKFDQEIDFAALRSFASDAFDWRCLGGAKKFIRNLAPAMLVRELRTRGAADPEISQESQEDREKSMIAAILGKRNHRSTDGVLEFRVSFIPADFVPIDLSIEEEDDDYRPAGGEADESDAEAEVQLVDESEDEAASGPAKRKRTMRPYDPMAPEKFWIPRDFLQLGCPLAVELYEASLRDPKAFLAQRHKAKAAVSGKGKGKKKKDDVQTNTMMHYGTVAKSNDPRPALKELNPSLNSRSVVETSANVFRHPSSLPVQSGRSESRDADLQSHAMPMSSLSMINTNRTLPSQAMTKLSGAGSKIAHAQNSPSRSSARPDQSAASPSRSNVFAAFRTTRTQTTAPATKTQVTPRKKRGSAEMASTPATQRTIDSFFSGTPRAKVTSRVPEVFDLTESSPTARPSTPSPSSNRSAIPDRAASPPHEDLAANPRFMDFELRELPSSVTKRKKRAPLKRHQTAPVRGYEELDSLSMQGERSRQVPASSLSSRGQPNVVDLTSSSPAGGGFLPPTIMRTFPNTHRSDVAPDMDHDSRETIVVVDRTSPVLRRSPRVSTALERKKLIQARKSMAGAWKEIDADTEHLDLTADDAGRRGHRVSSVEVLRLDG